MAALSIRKAASRMLPCYLLLGAYSLTLSLESMAQTVVSAAPDLYGQAASAMLNRSFPSAGTEYLLLDVESGRPIAMRWTHPEIAIPVGSLMKPFVALAYSELPPEPIEKSTTSSGNRSRTFPVLYCHGKRDGCWRAGGHGSIGLERAVAESCNAYFLALARQLLAENRDNAQSTNPLARVSAEYGLPAAPIEGMRDDGTQQSEQIIPRMLIGLLPEWRVVPKDLALAYARCVSHPENEAARRLLRGMQLAAGSSGTANKVGRYPGGVMAKTGTAPCIVDTFPDAPRCLANGDGLAIVVTPVDDPRLLLLVRQRGTSGAHAAEVAGKMLSQLESDHVHAR